MTATAYANDKKKARSLTAALKRLPDEWVVCRDVRHAWTVLNDFHVAQDVSGRDVIRRELSCLRCHTTRFETYTHTRFGLDKTRQSYGYPEDYQMKGVPRGVKPSAMIHAEQYRRAMERVAGGARNGDTPVNTTLTKAAKQVRKG